MSPRTIIVIAFAIIVIATVFLFTSAVPQDPEYHKFQSIPDRCSVRAKLLERIFQPAFSYRRPAAGLVYTYRRYADEVCVEYECEMAYYIFFIGISFNRIWLLLLPPRARQ